MPAAVVFLALPLAPRPRGLDTPRVRAFTIATGSLRATIDPAFGGAIADLRLADGAPILRPAPPSPAAFTELAMYPLCPWSNRIAGACFSFDGVEHTLRSDWPDGSAIHGVLKDAMLTPLDRSPVSARLVHEHSGDDRWPWAFRVIVRHEVDGAALISDLELTALDGPMPAGLGFHPHFLLDDQAWLRCPGLMGRYPATAQIPTGPAQPDEAVEALQQGCFARDLPDLDDCMLGTLDGAIVRTGAWEVRLACSASLGHAVVFTGASAARREFVCLEPVSHATNGLNQPANWTPGIARLERGETLTARLELRVRPIANGRAAAHKE